MTGSVPDRKSTRLNSSHLGISYAVFCLKKKKNKYSKLHSNDTSKYTSDTDSRRGAWLRCADVVSQQPIPRVSLVCLLSFFFFFLKNGAPPKLPPFPPPPPSPY